MQKKFENAVGFFEDYSRRLELVLSRQNWQALEELAHLLQDAWSQGKQVFLCGNGGSASNAVHFSNDLVYGIAGDDRRGIRTQALSVNVAVLTCVANDVSYDEIFSWQLSGQADKGDILIVFTGSGNSPNIVNAVQKAKEMGITTVGLLGYDGGKCLNLVDLAIHFQDADMQIAEDCQQIVCHMLMQWLAENGATSERV